MLQKQSKNPLSLAQALFAANLAGQPVGLTSVCSAHPLVLRAALASARDSDQLCLIEATCNQVNQDGGYTGMRPADFVARVADAARLEGVALDRVLLGGDHLGPQPWRHLPASQAMEKACVMVAEYVKAGFGKIHLDCSMYCAGDPEILSEETVAARAAQLARTAEDAASKDKPIYVIGTEVPPPGGMGEGHEIVATDPAHVAGTYEAHRAAFAADQLEGAFARVCGVVVQPGLDFGNEQVVHFDADAARDLSAQAKALGGAVFEAHSTDYQDPPAYAALVRGHFAILKVGPAATFAMREAIYALDALAAEIFGTSTCVRNALEAAMLSDPQYWESHYAGPPEKVAWLRHFGWSDRIRYYWTEPGVEAAVADLFTRLDGVSWPAPLVSQFMPALAGQRAKDFPASCETYVIDRVRAGLAPYYAASQPHRQS